MSRKILLLSPFPPQRDAVHGGSRAIAENAAELAVDNRLRILCLRGDDEPPTEDALANLCEGVEEIRRPGAAIGWERGRLWAHSLASGLPLWAGNWRVEAFRRAVGNVVETWKPDVVQFEFHVMAQYRDAVNKGRTVLVVHEPGAATAREQLRQGPWWLRGLRRREAGAWTRYETEALPGFDALVCFTPRDRDEMLAIAPGAEVAVIPPAYSAAGSSAAGSSSNQPVTNRLVVLFPGNFLHPPNVDAAMRLASRIFPAVLSSHPHATLHIVGQAPPPALVSLSSPRIVVTGRVPSMQPWLSGAAVVALPLSTGGGIRIKTIEALCAGKAMVGTALAAEGLDLRDGQEFVMADSDRGFADAISSLLTDPARRSTLEHNARAWGETFCRPGRVRAAFESLYQRLEAVRP